MYLHRTELIKHIKQMIHSCELDNSLHKLKNCPNKNIINQMLEAYRTKKWIPTIKKDERGE